MEMFGLQRRQWPNPNPNPSPPCDKTCRAEGDAMIDKYRPSVMCDHSISLVLLLSLWLCVIITLTLP